MNDNATHDSRHLCTERSWCTAIGEDHQEFHAGDTIHFESYAAEGDGISGWLVESRSNDLQPQLVLELKAAGQHLETMLPAGVAAMVLAVTATPEGKMALEQLLGQVAS